MHIGLLLYLSHYHHHYLLLLLLLQYCLVQQVQASLRKMQLTRKWKLKMVQEMATQQETQECEREQFDHYEKAKHGDDVIMTSSFLITLLSQQQRENVSSSANRIRRNCLPPMESIRPDTYS